MNLDKALREFEKRHPRPKRPRRRQVNLERLADQLNKALAEAFKTEAKRHRPA